MPSRPLTIEEEKRLVIGLRKISRRDRALILAQLFLGFRISEVLALTCDHVLFRGKVRERISLPPRLLKGGYGTTRSVVVVPELSRAIEYYLSERSAEAPLTATDPLFLSRNHGTLGAPKRLTRSMAEKLIKGHLCRILRAEPTGISSHSLRKTFAMRVYEATGFDLIATRTALGHSSVGITQVYLSPNQGKIDAAVLRRDWTRKPRHSRILKGQAFDIPIADVRPQNVHQGKANDTGWLPGLGFDAA